VLTLFVWIFCLTFLSILFNTSLNARMLECNTEIPYLDEPVKLVFKLHFSTWDLANIFRTMPGPGEFSELVPPLVWRSGNEVRRINEVNLR